MHFSRNNGNVRSLRKRKIVSNRADIGQNLEFETRFTESLEFHPRGATGTIAEDDRDRVSLTEISPMKFHRQGFEPGALMAGVGISQ